MVRNILIGIGAILLIAWGIITLQKIVLDSIYNYSLLITGVALVAAGCVAHYRTTQKAAEQTKTIGKEV